MCVLAILKVFAKGITSLHLPRRNYFRDPLFDCLFVGLQKYYWLKLYEKSEDLSLANLGPIKFCD